MPVDLDQIEMRQTIDQASPRDFANSPKVIVVDFVDIAANKLLRAVGNAVEHLVRIVQVMDRAEYKIEFVPVFLDPPSTRDRRLRIVVQLDSSANLYVRICRSKFVELVEINSGVIA